MAGDAPPYLGAILELFILALAVFVGAFVWDRTKNPAQALAYGAAVVLVILLFFLMLPTFG